VRERHHDVKPLATGGLAETFKAEFAETLPHFLGGLHDLREFDLRRGIKVEHQPPGYVGHTRRAIPGMQFEPARLRDGG